MQDQTKRPLECDDYAREAEAAERARTWPQAAALWRMAAERATEPANRECFRICAERCDGEVAVDELLAGIARRVLGVPTLAERKSDRLDFHEVSVWALKDALRLAYRAGKEAPRP